MLLIRSSLAIACAALGLLVSPPPAGAQSFVELGGGWNYPGPTTASGRYANGFHARASVGRALAPGFLVRFDAFAGEVDYQQMVTLPCPTFGCGRASTDHSVDVAGLTANGIVNVDSRGIFYLIGGVGLYDFDIRGPHTDLRPGVSAGAGLAVPVGVRMRAIVEARWHGLIGTAAGPAWIVPITVGFRY